MLISRRFGHFDVVLERLDVLAVLFLGLAALLNPFFELMVALVLGHLIYCLTAANI